MADVDWAGFTQLQQQNNQIANPMQRFAQGFQIGALMRQQNAINQAKEQETLAKQKLLNRQNALQSSLLEISKIQNPTDKVAALSNLGLLFPEMADNLNTASKTFNENAKTTAKNTLLPILSAIKNQRYDLAKNLTDTASEAFKNGGNTKAYEALRGVSQRLENGQDVGNLFNEASLYVSSILGWDETMAALKTGSETTSAEQKALQDISTTSIKAEEAKRAPIETQIKQEELIRAPLDTAIKQAELTTKGAEAKTKEQMLLADLNLKRQQLATAKANEAQSRQSITESRARTEKLYTVQKPTDANKIVDLGLPIPAKVPWANLVDGKERDKMQAAIYKAADKELNKRAAAIGDVISVVPLVQRFVNLNNEVETGGFLDRQAIGRGLGSVTNEKYDEMRSISAQLAPKQRQPGSGATSDFDAKQYERATLGVEKSKATNQSIANALIARAQAAEDYQSYLQDYLTQNGTLADAERNWKEYANKNPILDPKKPGEFVLNNKRMPYQTYFAIQAEKQARGIK